MEKYIFMVLGIILGIAISLYVYAVKREKYVKRVKNDQLNFSTERLDKALERAVNEMQYKMKEEGRTLSEQEKNEIIFGYLRDENND